MNEQRIVWDKVGICGASLCGLHCLFSGIAIAMAPSLGPLLKNEWLHLGLLATTVPIAFFALFSGKKVHQNAVPFLIFCGAVFFLISGYLIEEGILDVPFNAELITVFGSLLIIGAHCANILFIRKEKQRSCACC